MSIVKLFKCPLQQTGFCECTNQLQTESPLQHVHLNCELSMKQPAVRWICV